MIIPDTKKFDNGSGSGLYLLRSGDNVAAITNYGARWVSMVLPGRERLTDVVTGFDNLEGYLRSTEAYYGATVGRYANRIANGKFELDGKVYSLAVNNPPNHLHGGIKGFHDKMWEVVDVKENYIELAYLSPDLEEGFPGNLSVNVAYHLCGGEMEIRFSAVTDHTTVVNLTNHAYFNLNGQGSGDIHDHRLSVNADKYTPVDKTSIPTGQLADVSNTPFDFRSAKKIGEHIEQDDQQLKYGSGYDHNFVLNNEGDITFAAEAWGDKSGINMQVFTTEPGLQLYTGNFMAGNNLLKQGLRDHKRYAFCLETQHFPDSPNKPGFPSTVLRPGETYESVSIFKFQ
jgi:aldose 1-epimerase